jgi:SAM-dependent methyltransferase
MSQYWDAAAETFDDAADHGLRTPETYAAWAALFAEWVPAPSRVLDLGCGTGSLAVLLARQGHRVTGVDLSPRMVELARANAAGLAVDVMVGDASAPAVPGPFDVVVVRHVLWVLPDPHAALRTWSGLLGPGGRFVLVEGRWGEPAESRLDHPWWPGVPAATLEPAVAALGASVEVRPLTGPALWGKEVTDERYALLARF